jgi:hypothetical protein
VNAINKTPVFLAGFAAPICQIKVPQILRELMLALN